MPKPVLQAMVLADHVYRDVSGKCIIAGTFGTMLRSRLKVSKPQTAPDGERQLVTGPVQRVGSPYLYLALFDVHGQVPLEIKFVDLSDSSVLFEAQFTVASTDPVAVAEYILPMPMLPVKNIGNYSLDLLHENELRARTLISGT